MFTRDVEWDIPNPPMRAGSASISLSVSLIVLLPVSAGMNLERMTSSSG